MLVTGNWHLEPSVLHSQQFSRKLTSFLLKEPKEIRSFAKYRYILYSWVGNLTVLEGQLKTLWGRIGKQENLCGDNPTVIWNLSCMICFSSHTISMIPWLSSHSTWWYKKLGRLEVHFLSGTEVVGTGWSRFVKYNLHCKYQSEYPFWRTFWRSIHMAPCESHSHKHRTLLGCLEKLCQVS